MSANFGVTLRFLQPAVCGKDNNDDHENYDYDDIGGEGTVKRSRAYGKLDRRGRHNNNDVFLTEWVRLLSPMRLPANAVTLALTSLSLLLLLGGGN